MRSVPALAAVLAASVLAGVPSARAEEAPEQGRQEAPHAEAHAGRPTVTLATDAPLQAGLRVAWEGPHRIRASTSVGVLPPPYLDVINEAAIAAGAYDEETARLVKRSLESSLVVRVHAGWRPLRGRGFYVDGGFGLVTLGGSATGEDLLALSTGLAPPSGFGSDRRYDVASSLHMLDLEAGWEWHPARRLQVRTALGFSTTINATTRIEPRFQPLAPALVEGFTRDSEQYLDETFEKYVHLPLLTVAAGWRF